MAEFNPRLQETMTPPSYVSASQGVRGEADTSGAIIAEGLAKALQQGVEGVDRLIQENIEEDVEAGYDAINAEFGFNGEGVDGPMDVRPDAAKPVGYTNAEAKIKDLQAIYEAGGTSETYYWSRMNTMLKNLRARYPGYRTEVDGLVRSVTGSDPTARLREVLFANAGKEDPAAKQYRELAERAAFAGLTPPDFEARAAAGTPYTYGELLNHVAGKARTKTDLEATRAELAYSHELRNVTKDQANLGYRDEFSQLVSDTLQNTVVGAGQTYNSIMQMVKKGGETGGNFTAEEKVQIRQMVGALKSSLLTMGAELANQSWNGKDPSAKYLTYMTTEEINQAQAAAMLPITILEDVLNSEDWGLLKMTASWLKANEEKRSADLLRKYPTLNQVAGMKDALGPELTSSYMYFISEDINAILMQILGGELAQAHLPITPGEPPPSLAKDYSKARENNLPANYYPEKVETWTKIVKGYSDGDIPASEIAKDVRYMFGPENFHLFGQLGWDGPDSKVNYFNLVASPNITKAMLGLKEAGDPQAYNVYKQWVLNAFQDLSREAFAELQSFNLDPRALQIVFNPQTNQFTMVEDPGFKERDVTTQGDEIFGMGGLPGMAVQGLVEMDRDYVGREARAQMNKLNSMILTVSPILEADKQNVSQALTMLFERFMPKQAQPQPQPQPQ